MAEGQEVSIYYDPMLAKLTAWAPTRELSLRRMEVALSQFQVLGVVTNIPLLRSVVRHPQFQRGEYDTGFLEWNPAVTDPHPNPPPEGEGSRGETRMMTRALAAWASRQPTSPASPQAPAIPASTGSSRGSASPWQAAGEQRLP